MRMIHVLIAAVALVIGASANTIEERCNYCQVLARYLASEFPETNKANIKANCDEGFEYICDRAEHRKVDIATDSYRCGAAYACREHLGECPNATTCIPPAESVGCDLCKTVVGKARSALSKASVDAAIKLFCSITPLPAGCNVLISKGADAILDIIRKYTDDNFACTKIGLC